MEKRNHDLCELRQYAEAVENKLTTIFQNLNWDQDYLLQMPILATCKYDSGHQVPVIKKESHEKMCFLKYHDYSQNDLFLPDIPPGAPEQNVCKLSKDSIRNIVNIAAQNDPMFQQGLDNEGPEPLTLDRLQCTYTSDERRAIHDAVVKTAPAIHDLSDLALPSGSGEMKDKIKTRLEVLAELRNMKRRRMKYRVAANTSKYSHVLKELIKTQMEYYTSSVKVKSEDSSSHSKDTKKYSQGDCRSKNRQFQTEEHAYKRSYNSNQEKYQNVPNVSSTSYKNSYNNDKHKSKESRYSSDRHYEDSSNHRKSYAAHSRSRSNNSSKIHDEKYYQERYNRSKHEHTDKDHPAHEKYRGNEQSRNREPSHHRRHRKH